jgi:DNA topoisomerase-1
MSSLKHHDYRKTATRAGLHYVTDGLAGISRRRSGTGWSYSDEAGARIGDPVARQRFSDLVIPPAWKDVWICPDPDGHIQVTARDALGRKQYRYHPLYRMARDVSKFRHMLEFSEVLPALRDRVERDLRASPQSRRQLLATVVWLLDKTLIRVGNDEYAKENHSYGLTTMLKKHAKVTGAVLSFSFRGKSGVEHVVAVDDPRLARIVQRSQESHGQEIFQYLDATGKRKPILSDDVNNYLRQVSGLDISAKDFRTWGGTMVAALALRTMGAASNPTEAEHNIVQALEAVALRLGNTRAVCRKYYVHPALLIAYHLGLTAPVSHAQPNKRRGSSRAALRHDEQVVLKFLLESAAA